MSERVQFESRSAEELFGKPAAAIGQRAGIYSFYKVADNLETVVSTSDDLGHKIQVLQTGFGVIFSTTNDGYVPIHHFTKAGEQGVWVSGDQLGKYMELMGLDMEDSR